MIIVRLLRWMFGYVEFMVEGKFPERFLNLAAGKGVNLWKLHSRDKTLTGCARRRELPALRQAAVKTQNTLHTAAEHGLPFLVRDHKHRCGLLAGILLAVALYGYLSGFVWEISISAPEMINEAELRSLLREQGFYEGARISSVNIDRLINDSVLLDNRISWMTINLNGSHAEINVSPNLAKNLPPKAEGRTSNLLSSADGTVTQVKVKNGTAMVKAGDGIRKDQLLVSGVLEYNNGTMLVVDSDAQVFAKTAGSVTLSVPKEQEVFRKGSKTVTKTDLECFGVRVPLSLCATPAGAYTKQNDILQMTLPEHSLPLSVLREEWQEYQKEPAVLSQQQAQVLLKNRLALYEVFMLAEKQEGRLLRQTTSLQEDSGSFFLTAHFELEEDVCRRSLLEIQEPIAPDRTGQNQEQNPS